MSSEKEEFIYPAHTPAKPVSTFKVRSNRPVGYVGLDKLDVTTPGGKQIAIRFVQGSSGIGRSIIELVQEIAKEMDVGVETTSTSELP